MSRECCICGKNATWSYMPGASDYCDDCVPRGCSCNLEPKPKFDYIETYEEEPHNPEHWQKAKDDKGRELPCCEYWEIDEEVT